MSEILSTRGSTDQTYPEEAKREAGNVKRRNVKSRYLAMSGTLMDVGGRILETRSRKTTRASRMEIHIVILDDAGIFPVHGNTHGHLFPGVGGQIEDTDAEE